MIGDVWGERDAFGWFIILLMGEKLEALAWCHLVG
jgi:hypothetical protein